MIIDWEEREQVQVLPKARPSHIAATRHLIAMPDCTPAVIVAASSYRGFSAGMATVRLNISARTICYTAKSSAYPTVSGNQGWMPESSSTQRNCEANG